jgi:hypothetical protein
MERDRMKYEHELRLKQMEIELARITDTEPPLYNEIIFYTLGHSTLKLTEH